MPRRIYPIALLTMLLAAPAVSPAATCDGEAWVESTLYMGRGLADGGMAADSEIDAFVADTIVPAFPDGFPLHDARGHWRAGTTGRAAGASTVVLGVAPPPGAPAAPART